MRVVVERILRCFPGIKSYFSTLIEHWPTAIFIFFREGEDVDHREPY